MSERRSSQRFHSLNSEQVEVLDQVLSEVVPIHGRGNFPTLELRPRDIITAVRTRLEKQGITVRDVRLNGSTASHVLVRDNGTSYKDLDIIFGVELPKQEDFQVIKESVLGCLLDCLPAGVNRERISSATMKDAYVQKMVKVFNEHDRWSLISLSNNSGKNLELKFVSALRRQFEFSVDSFQIILDRLLESYLQQEAQQVENSLGVNNQASENLKRNSSSRPNPPIDSKPEGSDSSGEDLSRKESAQANQVDHTGKEEQSLAKELSTELPKQEKDKKQQTEFPEQVNITEVGGLDENDEDSKEANLGELTPVNYFPENKQDSDDMIQTSQPELFQQEEGSLQVQHSAQIPSYDDEEPLTRSHNLNHKEHCSQMELPAQTDVPNETELSEQEECLKQTQHLEPFEDLNAGQRHSKESFHSESLDKESSDKESSEKESLDQDFSDNDFSEHSTEEQRDGEGGKPHHTCISEAGTSTDAATEIHPVLEDVSGKEIDTEGQIAADRKTDVEDVTEQVATTETTETAQTSAADSSSASSLSVTQCTGTPEIHGTLHTESSENMTNTADTVNPAETQDIVTAPTSLVSDQNNCCLPSSKAVKRISQMVVLKHSSPKPPRRMCRKVAANANVSPASDAETVIAPSLDVNPSPSFKPETASDPEVSSVSLQSLCLTFASPDDNLLEIIPGPTPDSSDITKMAPNPEFISAPDPVSNLSPAAGSISRLPQDPRDSEITTEDSSQTHTLPTQVDCDKQRKKESSSPVPMQTEPLDAIHTSVAKTEICCTPTQDPPHTSVAELGVEEANAEWQTDTRQLDEPPFGLLLPAGQRNNPSTLPSFHAASSPVSCLTPPVLSLSPPCLAPPSPSLSPPLCLSSPQCLTSPMLSVSPPPSFSETSSCLSSPPYLTPPMLSLSPPPLSLSPPLLCLTPPVESEGHVSQVSPDMEPLILNTGCEGQIVQSSPLPAVPLLQLPDKKEEDSILPLPLVSERVSFPTAEAQTHTQPGETGESDPPIAAEVASFLPENKKAPKVSADKLKQSIPLRAFGIVPAVEVLAESMYGDFEAAMNHLRYRLIATRNPEEIRGGGLLKYSNLLVRDYRPASETQIKTLERYMCSRFFIDFPDVQEQQRKILSYLKNHFIGEERSKYQYLMTLRRVVDDSTVCLMGHERRQTLNMITVLALKVLGEQNIIPNTDHVTCFYQPAPYLAEHSAPYLAEPSYCSYYIPQGGSTLLYQPYPLHLNTQTGLV